MKRSIMNVATFLVALVATPVVAQFLEAPSPPPPSLKKQTLVWCLFVTGWVAMAPQVCRKVARYIMCPLHEAPANGDISPGNDIVQGYPVHFEWQPPSQFSVVKVGDRGSDTIPFQNLFGPTPPMGAGPFAEHLIEDNFHCLQRTGNWCP
jgi:hypothetical protein